MQCVFSAHLTNCVCLNLFRRTEQIFHPKRQSIQAGEKTSKLVIVIVIYPKEGVSVSYDSVPLHLPLYFISSDYSQD